jgi:hypothetical protein
VIPASNASYYDRNPIDEFSSHQPPATMHIRQNPSPSTTVSTKVPYFVLHLPDGRAKALFTVPSDMAEVLVLHPIMARGACFHLQVDVVSQGRPILQRRHYSSTGKTSNLDDTTDNDANVGDGGAASVAVATSFLSTEFVSPRPEETALAISDRIGIRMSRCPDGSRTTSATTMALAGLFGMP